MKTEEVSFREGEALLKGVFLYNPEVGVKRPGVLVIHEAWGLVRHTIERARMLAELGYVALAADMFGGGQVISDVQQAVGVVTDLRGNPSKLRSRVRAALTTLATHSEVDATRLAAIGYCFGGSAVLELARDGADISCVVSFHGGLPTAAPAELGMVKAKILVCTGSDDPYAPKEHINAFEDEMSAAGADWQLICYGSTPHSFTNPDADGSIDPAIQYHERSDKRSWAAMRLLFEEVFPAKGC